MAKIKGGITSLSGKFEDVVHVQSNKYKPHVRKAISGSGNKDEPAFKAQTNRTTFLSRLASDLNNIMMQHSGLLREKSYYHDVLKLFRKEPLDNRFLLLMKLKGREVNRVHKLDKLSYHSAAVNVVKNKLRVALQVKGHPDAGRHKADCYYYEVLLVTWTKGPRPGVVQQQLSEWVHRKDKVPVFDFEFVLGRGVVHWMVCLRVVLGIQEKEIGSVATEGMAVLEVGSLDKKDYAVLEERGKAVEMNRAHAAVKEVARVKAREG